MNLLEVNHLDKSFASHKAVDEVSFQMQAGEILGLLGPNGAGKSTTIQMLAGLVEPDSGSVVLNGKVLNSRGGTDRVELGVVPQDISVYPQLTTRENLKFFGGLYGLRDLELSKRIDEILERVGLKERADDQVQHYSGGMKRRLNFGIGLLHRPKLLILDEPTVGVDPQSRSHILEAVRELGKNGVAILYVSHYMEEVQELCQRVAVMDRGKLLVCDRLETMLSPLPRRMNLSIPRLENSMETSLTDYPGVSSTMCDEQTSTITVDGEMLQSAEQFAEAVSFVFGLLSQNNVTIRLIEAEEPDLENLFMQLTGHSLRD